MTELQRCDCGTEYVGRACWRCRMDENRRRLAVRNRVRRPPRLPFADAPSGVCRLCGVAVKGRRVTWCSDDCVWLWRTATGGSHLAHYWLSQEFGAVCWVCWDEVGDEVDHVRPLWSLLPEERTELRWWLPFNLQLIGPHCHKAKTRREAGLRAAWQRGERWPLDLLRMPTPDLARQGVLL